MNEFVETLWHSFEIETQEHLDYIEPLLARAEAGELDCDAIAQLFRSFHSIKGLAAAMDMTGIETVAHRSEDLLGLIRNGEIAPAPPLVALLVEALDAVSTMREAAVARRRDTSAPEHLLAQLAEVARTAPAEATREGRPWPAPAASEGSGALLADWQPDPETGAFFADLMQANAAALAGPMSPRFGQDLDDRAALDDAVEALSHAAGVLDLPHLLDVVREMGKQVPASGPLSAPQLAEFASMFQRFLDFAAVVERRFGAPAGRDEAAAALRDIYGEAPPAEALVQLVAGLASTARAARVPAAAVPGSEPLSTPTRELEDHRGATAPAVASSDETIRIQSKVLDQFMNRIGETILVRSQLAHAVHDGHVRSAMAAMRARLERWRSGQTPIRGEFDEMAEALCALDEQQSRIARVDAQLQGSLRRLQDDAMDLRVVPIDMVFKRCPRIVRDLSARLGKKVRLELIGTDVRIDRGMVNALVDPLVHLLRNSVDHGIERPDDRIAAGKPAHGRIALRASQRGDRVVVELIDDGRGLDVERIRARAVSQGLVTDAKSRRLAPDQLFPFILSPGFSTRSQVTETSGRGVGMDVVRTMVTRLGGDLRFGSEPGRGSTFALELPLSAAVLSTLIVEVRGQSLAIPDRFVAEILQTTTRAFQSVRGRLAILLRDVFLPVVHLGDLLGRPPEVVDADVQHVVVLSNGERRVGVVVDRLWRREELFVKSIHPQLAALPGVAAASILGDGRVVLILDGEDLIRLAARGGPSALHGLVSAREARVEPMP